MGQQIKIKVNSQLRELLLTHIQTTKHSDIPPNIEDIINVKSSNLYAKQKSKNKSSDDPSESSTKENEEFLSVSDMRWLHDNVVKNLENVYLHEMLGDGDIILPVPEVLPRNPELEARVQKLKVQQMEREYRSMTRNVDSVRVNYPEDTLSYQMKQINRQLIAVIQLIVSVGAGFTFGFIGVELLVGELDFGFRLLLGVMCALVIGLAEIYFLAKKLADDLVPPSQPGDEKQHQD